MYVCTMYVCTCMYRPSWYAYCQINSKGGVGLAANAPTSLNKIRCMYECTAHVCMYACMYVCVCVCVCMYVYMYIQWCGNSQSCRTLSDKSSECPVKQN